MSKFFSATHCVLSVFWRDTETPKNENKKNEKGQCISNRQHRSSSFTKKIFKMLHRSWCIDALFWWSFYVSFAIKTSFILSSSGAGQWQKTKTKRNLFWRHLQTILALFQRTQPIWSRMYGNSKSNPSLFKKKTTHFFVNMRRANCEGWSRKLNCNRFAVRDCDNFVNILMAFWNYQWGGCLYLAANANAK